MYSRTVGALAIAVAVAALAVSDAKAQDAQTLFDRGLKAMLDGRYESGCPDIERSYELDPQPGARFTLAACYERWGKLLTAAGHYSRYLTEVRNLPAAEAKQQEKRVATTNDKLAELRPQIPKLQLNFDAAPPDDAIVTLDGKSVAPSDLGVDLPVDPGEHRIEVRTAAGAVDERTVRIEVGQSQTVLLSVPTGGEGADEPDQMDEPDGAGGWTGMHTGAVVAGAIGVVGLVIGGVTGGMVFAKKGTVDDECNDQNVCSEDGKAAADDGKSLATVSTVTFVVGGVALAGGVVLWLLAPSLSEPDQETASIRLHVGSAPGDPESAVIGVGGTF
ncbi:MAG: hypothetical protein JRI55_08890 [Deltaproteobacteria bacterium]|jgi:hypothetical protein|nr:hypothetical protein [Deltaproteobacteria bacterium]